MYMDYWDCFLFTNYVAVGNTNIMSNFLGGLLSAASSFLPGGGLLSKIIPGAVNAIGDIAGKVINRPKGQGIGEALLEAAPGALMNAAGLAQTANEHIKGPTNSYLQAQAEEADRRSEADPERNAKRTEFYITNTAANSDFGDTNESVAKMVRDDPGQYYYSTGLGKDLPDMGILAKYGATGPLGPLVNPDVSKPQSTSATDHLPIRHGPTSQPHMLPQNTSGPFTAHGQPPAAAYIDERMHKQERPQTAYEQSLTRAMHHPQALLNRQGRSTHMDRTQQQSFGYGPSFNAFDKFSRLPNNIVEINEPEIFSEEEPEERDRTIIRYIKRKAPKSKRRR